MRIFKRCLIGGAFLFTAMAIANALLPPRVCGSYVGPDLSSGGLLYCPSPSILAIFAEALKSLEAAWPI